MSVIFIVNLLSTLAQPVPLQHDWQQVTRVGTSLSGRTQVMVGRARAEINDEALVELEPGIEAQTRFEQLRLVGVRQLLPTRPLWLVKDAAGVRDGLRLAQDLKGASGLRWGDPNFFFARVLSSISVPPNDPRYPGQWYMKNIDIERAWRRNTGSPDVTVQVIDNGCDLTHPDLAGHLLPGRDVISGDDDPTVMENSNHGTACAGIIAAVGDNGLGIAGACPECKVRCVRFLDDNAMVPVSADVDALRFALQHDDIAVVSNSWGFIDQVAVPSGLKAAIEDVSRLGHGGKGALVIFASGNNDRQLAPEELYTIPEVLTVGAINNFDEIAPFSNYGATLDLVAPTGSVTLDLVGAAGESPTDYTVMFGGTSSAAPVVSGVAALLFAAKPTATAAEIRELIISTARRAPFAVPDSKGHDLHYGYGIVDPGHAIEVLLGVYDGGAVDAGVDAGSRGDAGVDAGQPIVNEVIDSNFTPVGAGCGCSGTSSTGWLVAVILMLAYRRVRHQA